MRHFPAFNLAVLFFATSIVSSCSCLGQSALVDLLNQANPGLKAQIESLNFPKGKDRQLPNLSEIENLRKELNDQELSLPRQMRGGGSSNGGGGGVLCIEDGKKSLFVNDFWEVSHNLELEPILPGESAIQYLFRVLETNIKPLDSYFYSRLIESLFEVLYSPWFQRNDLQLLDDIGTRVVPLRPNCKPFQIVIRYSLLKPGYHPDLFFDYEPQLLNLLDVRNLAMLLLHEAVYVWGSDLQQSDSSKVRSFVRFLLSKPKIPSLRYGDVDLITPQLRTTLFQSWVRRLGFADFVQLYNSDASGTSATRIDLQRRMTYSSFKSKLYGKLGGVQSMTAEENFYFFYSFHPNPSANSVRTLEEYIQSLDPETSEVVRVCTLAKQYHKGNGESQIISLTFQDKLISILQYCNSLGASSEKPKGHHP